MDNIQPVISGVHTQQTAPQIAPVTGRTVLWNALRYLLCFAALLLLLSTVTDFFHLPTSILDQWRTENANGKYDMVLLGNSMTKVNIDSDSLQKQLKVKILNLAHSDTTYSYWYLQVKNLITSLKTPPKLLLLTFRETELTQPSKSVLGEGTKNILSLSPPSGIDPLVDQLGLQPQMSWIEHWVFLHFRFYQAKAEISDDVYQGVTYITALMIRYPYVTVDTFINNALRTDQILFPAADKSSEKWLNDSYNQPMETLVKQTYLPSLIQELQKMGTQLVIVRVKERKFIKTPVPAKLAKYNKDLSNYLSKQHVIFMDFSKEPSLTGQDYADWNDHLNAKGQKIFTDLLAKKLKPILKNSTPAK